MVQIVSRLMDLIITSVLPGLDLRLFSLNVNMHCRNIYINTSDERGSFAVGDLLLVIAFCRINTLMSSEKQQKQRRND